MLFNAWNGIGWILMKLIACQLRYLWKELEHRVLCRAKGLDLCSVVNWVSVGHVMGGEPFSFLIWQYCDVFGIGSHLWEIPFPYLSFSARRFLGTSLVVRCKRWHTHSAIKSFCMASLTAIDCLGILHFNSLKASALMQMFLGGWNYARLFKTADKG